MEDYIKEKNFFDLNENQKNTQLMQNILKTQNELKQAHINFEYAENELIDFYTYQIKANQAKLDYLTKLAKKQNLSIEVLEQI